MTLFILISDPSSIEKICKRYLFPAFISFVSFFINVAFMFGIHSFFTQLCLAIWVAKSKGGVLGIIWLTQPWKTCTWSCNHLLRSAMVKHRDWIIGIGILREFWATLAALMRRGTYATPVFVLASVTIMAPFIPQEEKRLRRFRRLAVARTIWNIRWALVRRTSHYWAGRSIEKSALGV